MPDSDSILNFTQWTVDSVQSSVFNSEFEIQNSELYLCGSNTSDLRPPTSDLNSDLWQRTSLFTGHGFAPQNAELQPRAVADAPVWLFVWLVALVALTTLYYRQHKLRLKDLLPALVDNRAMDRLQRNTSLTHTINLLPMGLLAVASVAVLCLQSPLSGLWPPASDLHSPLSALVVTAGLSVVYLLRNGLARLLALVFDDSAAVGNYIASNYLYHLALATVLLALLPLLVYLPVGKTAVLYTAAGVVVAELLARLVRGLKLFLTQTNNSHFYLFYYLCIVETAPILVLTKLIIA